MATANGVRAQSPQHQVEEAWRLCGDLFCRAIGKQVSTAQGDVDHEILFCLLGGFGITYEHGRAATDVIGPLAPFAREWDDEVLYDTLVSSLSLAQFEPQRRDGTLRRYRFPRRKARLIVDARRWILEHSPIHDRVAEFPDCRSRRQFLCDCPGIGPKTASWLLRNLGWGSEVGIIDVHVLSALRSAGRIRDRLVMPRDYEEAEVAFLEWCDELAAPPAAFDLFLWEWQRGTLITS